MMWDSEVFSQLLIQVRLLVRGSSFSLLSYLPTPHPSVPQRASLNSLTR